MQNFKSVTLLKLENLSHLLTNQDVICQLRSHTSNLNLNGDSEAKAVNCKN